MKNLQLLPEELEAQVEPTAEPVLDRISHILVRLSGGREIWALGDQAVISGVNFLTNIMLARATGPAQFGVFALAWMALLALNSLQVALIVAPMMSVAPKQPAAKRPRYFGAVFLQELCFASLCAVVLFLAVRLASVFIRNLGIRQLALPLAFCTLCYLLQEFLRRYLFTTRQTRRGFANDGLSYLPQLPLLFLLARHGHLTNANALWVIALTSALGIAVACTWLERVSYSWSGMQEVASRHWKMSRWLAPSALLQLISGNLFVIVAPILYGPAAAGALRAAQNLVGVAHIWFLGLDNVVPSEAARRLQNHGLEHLLSYTKQVLLRWGGITFAFVLVVSSAPGFLLRLAYGWQYGGFGPIVQLFGLTYLMVFIGTPLRAALQALEYTKPIFWSYSAMAAFSAVLAVPLAKSLGLIGVMLGIVGIQLIFQCTLGLSLAIKVRELRRSERCQLLQSA